MPRDGSGCKRMLDWVAPRAGTRWHCTAASATIAARASQQARPPHAAATTMPTNPRFALGLVAVLGAVAALLWFVQRPPASHPTADGAGGHPPPPAVAPPDSASPVVAAPEAPTQAVVAPPEAPTLTDAGTPPSAAGSFYARTVEDGQKVLDLAIEAAGGRRALAAIQRATATQFASGDVLQFQATTAHDGNRAVRLTLADPDAVVGHAGAVCWRQWGAVVAPCHDDVARVAAMWRWMHAASVILPLRDAPWELGEAGAQVIQGQRVNVLRFAQPGVVEEVQVHFDPSSHRLVRLEVSRKDQCCRDVVDFSDPRGFGGASLPALRRIVFDAGGKQPSAVTAVLADLKPGADAGAFRVPAWTQKLPVSSATRPEFMVLEAKAGSHDGIYKAAQDLAQSLGASSHFLHSQVYEALGDPASAATLAAGIAVWQRLARDGAGAPAGVRKRATTVPAVGVERTVLRVALGEIIGRAANAVADARGKGLAAAPGRVTVRYLSDVDKVTQAVTVEIDVPVLRER